MYTPREIINLALLIEENGEVFYLDVAKKAENEETKTILSLLAEEERKHRLLFMEMKKKIDLSMEFDIAEKVSSFFIGDGLEKKFFSGRSVDNIQDAIVMAITLEEESVLFYEILRNLTENDDTLAVIDEIIQEEKKHIETLHTIREKIGFFDHQPKE